MKASNRRRNSIKILVRTFIFSHFKEKKEHVSATVWLNVWFNCLANALTALRGHYWSWMCWILSEWGWWSLSLATVLCLRQYNRATLLPMLRVLMCAVTIHHTDTNTHQLARTKTHREKHRVSPFPASWLASVLYCPALKRDLVSSSRRLLCSHVAEDKEMFLLA